MTTSLEAGSTAVDAADTADLDTLLNTHFAGRVVRKDLTQRVKEGANVPVYVLEYLLGMYCKKEFGEKLMSTEPELIQSPLSQAITRDGHTLQVDIYRLEEDIDWVLEVINEDGTSHVWEDRFSTDQAALDALHAAIEEEGIGAFLD